MDMTRIYVMLMPFSRDYAASENSNFMLEVILSSYLILIILFFIWMYVQMCVCVRARVLASFFGILLFRV